MPNAKRDDNPRDKQDRRERLLGSYATLPGVHDEMLAADGSIRPQWEGLLDEWTNFSPDELLRRIALAERHLSDAGVSYRIRNEASLDDMLAGERSWPMSHMPLPIAEDCLLYTSDAADE